MDHQDAIEIESDSMDTDIDDPRQLDVDEDDLCSDEYLIQPSTVVDQETGQTHASTVQNEGSEPSATTTGSVGKRGGSSRQNFGSEPTTPEASAEEDTLTVSRYPSNPPTITALRTIPLPGGITPDEQELTFPHVDIRLGHGEQSVLVLFTPFHHVARIWSHGTNGRLPALSDRTLPPPPLEEDPD